LLGLQWGDCEFGKGRLYVRRQLEAITGELAPPKTAASTRFVSLPPVAMSELKRWKIECPHGELDFVFPNTNGTAMDDRNFRMRTFYPALRRAGLRKVRVHDLRHTAASMLIAAGADLADVSRQMGHANVSITLSVYTHHFARRGGCDLGARLAEFVAREADGPVSVPAAPAAAANDAEVIDNVVARGGIEPPTRGFSVRCSTN
jgi:integrase